MKSLYALLLYLFPSAYREEYGDELQSVFNLSLDDAIKIGPMEVAWMILRELIGLPQAILYEHLRERRRMKMAGKFTSRLNFPPGSRFEPLAVFVPFIVFFGIFYLVLAVLSPDTPPWLAYLVLLTPFFIIFVIALIQGLPRWILPFLGFFLSIVSAMMNPAIINPEWRGFPSLRLAPEFINSLVYEGLFQVGFIVFLILLVLFAVSIPKFHPFYLRLRDDWTLLAFVVYGAEPLAIFLTFDEYQDEEPYVWVAYTILVVGGWFYLRSASPWKRFGFLFAGQALSMAVVAIGKTVLYDSPVWIWQNEIYGTFITWIWLVLMMLMSPALNLLPRPKNRLQTT